MSAKSQSLFDLLLHSVDGGGDTGVVSYRLHDTDHDDRKIRYDQLLHLAQTRASILQLQYNFKPGGVVLLHFSDHLDNIVWFWSVLLAGAVPALSSPLPNDRDQRQQHLEHIFRLFNDPVCLARASEFAEFATCPRLALLAVDDLEGDVPRNCGIEEAPLPAAHPDDLAALMLTSGSTGNAKAVELSHRQILASLAGKNGVTCLSQGVALLNWIGMDHVAALVETHLLALYRGLDQVHVQPPDIVADPLLLLRIATKHNVARIVAPNFLLAGLLKSLERSDALDLADLDLAGLTQLVSGGEANPVQLCVRLNEALQRLGAPAGILQPSFGMTETCAGCTYNTACPAMDARGDMDFASLGTPVEGFQVRVVADVDEHLSQLDRPGARGTLQIRGPLVFSKYYNDPIATADAFTSDGWFKTGDEALIDETGNVHIIGRVKDLVRINGVGIVASDLESHLNALSLPGAVEGFYACFGYRRVATDSESLAILYLPAYLEDDDQGRRATNDEIIQSVLQNYSTCPYVLPVDAGVLQKSTLGKLSRSKLRRALESGKLERYEVANARDSSSTVIEPQNETEAQLLSIFRQTLTQTLDIPEDLVGLRTSWYTLGITSIQLIRLKREIELGLGLADVPLVKLLNCSTIEELAKDLPPRGRRDSVTGVEVSLDDESLAAYDPVVKLRTQGSNTPLWLFHPGVGEVLVFINLAKQVQDRPVYALRARGFNAGESFFQDIEEAVDTYYHAIKQQQSHGPYALAGYSYGAMLAFETAKKLNNDGDGSQVRFLASFNLPPHIKFRMQQLDWRACALHLAHFLGLLQDPDLKDHPQPPEGADHASITNAVFHAAPQERLRELSLTPDGFSHWADLAHSMQSMARGYTPAGAVPCMDVFYCQPLAVVAQSTREWLACHISRWSEVARDVRFHQVGGEHYTMIDAAHVEPFMATFRDALAARGL